MKSPKKQVITITLGDREIRLLNQLAKSRGVTKGNLIGHALRVLATMDARLASGAKVYFEDESKNKAELLLL
jgi:hypothetical protein